MKSSEINGRSVASGNPSLKKRSALTIEPALDLARRIDAYALQSGRSKKAAALALIERGLRNVDAELEHPLQRREDRLHTVLNSIGDAFYVLDRDQRFLFASQSALDLWGKDVGDVLGREFLACFPQADGSEAFEAHLRVADTGIPERIETISPVLGHWLEVDLAPSNDGVLWVALRDIRKRKAAEQALIESEERLRSAVEVGRLGLWDMDVRTGASHWSDRHYEMQGYEPGEVAPTYEAWLARIHPDDRADAEAAVILARDSREDYISEYRTVFPDGSVHWRSARGRFFHNAAGDPTRMIGAATDITDQREWEERQKALVSELQHRTGNLMAVVQAMADLTARGSANFDEFLPRFRHRLGALARVQDLLSRLEEGDRVTFDELVRTEMTALHGTGTNIELNGPSGVRLRSAAVQTLALALHELGTNALKYGALAQPSGALAISWKLDSLPTGEPSLHVEWTESGVKMPPAGARARGSGQGRRLLEVALPRQLNAMTTYNLGPDGVHCTIDLPLSEGKGKTRPAG